MIGVAVDFTLQNGVEIRVGEEKSWHRRQKGRRPPENKNKGEKKKKLPTPEKIEEWRFDFANKRHQDYRCRFCLTSFGGVAWSIIGFG
ncbi:hypothetical protein TIFTF001_004549 [Ficus carica]|uniref:Uncharacterized protein n=1 Tax=Ficus carica TaxID=3494 RepID=A0AA88A4V6_FICCA|nr:hypothetical protein TIFTF001_004549 [Ficus carica]